MLLVILDDQNTKKQSYQNEMNRTLNKLCICQVMLIHNKYGMYCFSKFFFAINATIELRAYMCNVCFDQSTYIELHY